VSARVVWELQADFDVFLAISKSAAPPGRYVAFSAAFEPLQRRSAGFTVPIL